MFAGILLPCAPMITGPCSICNCGIWTTETLLSCLLPCQHPQEWESSADEHSTAPPQHPEEKEHYTFNTP